MSTISETMFEYEMADCHVLKLSGHMDWMTDLNAAYHSEGRPAPEDDDGWARIAYRIDWPPKMLQSIRRNMTAYGLNQPCPDWMFEMVADNLDRHRERRDRRAALLRFLGVLPAVAAMGVRT